MATAAQLQTSLSSACVLKSPRDGWPATPAPEGRLPTTPPAHAHAHAQVHCACHCDLVMRVDKHMRSRQTDRHFISIVIETSSMEGPPPELQATSQRLITAQVQKQSPEPQTEDGITLQNSK